MSAAAAAEAAPPKGKKKLIIMIAAAVLVLGLGGGGAAVFMAKKKAAAAAEAAAAEDEEGGGHAKAKPKGKDAHAAAPVFLPLEPFVVNLADKEADRFAQVGITLEIADAKAADELKAYMPAIRNGILMVLAHKTSKELLERSGKEALAIEVMRESVRPLGYEPSEDEAEEKPAKEGAKDADDADAKPKKKKKKKAVDPGPVKHVHFSSFIIQ